MSQPPPLPSRPALSASTGRPPTGVPSGQLRGGVWLSASLLPVLAAAMSLGMPGCTAEGFQGSHVEPVWAAYPVLTVEAAFRFTAAKPPAGFVWTPLLIGVPVGLALAVCPVVMVLAPTAARRRAMAAGGWVRKVRLSDCSLLGPWAVVWADPKHLLQGFWVLTWSCTAQLVVFVFAAVTSKRAVSGALPPPPPPPTVTAGEKRP